MTKITSHGKSLGNGENHAERMLRLEVFSAAQVIANMALKGRINPTHADDSDAFESLVSLAALVAQHKIIKGRPSR